MLCQGSYTAGALSQLTRHLHAIIAMEHAHKLTFTPSSLKALLPDVPQWYRLRVWQ